MKHHSLIRYPGSKAKLISTLCRVAFPDSLCFSLWSQQSPRVYCEPFVGAGAMLIAMLDQLPKQSAQVVVSDKDYWMVCLWQALATNHETLCKMVMDFTPTTDAFYAFKKQDGDMTVSPTEAGFRKLALHHMSVSGFGVKSGGPLGGRKQKSEYKVSCRFNNTSICRKLIDLHKSISQFCSFTIRCLDFEATLAGLPPSSFVYLDPPYYEKGDQLYKHAMTDQDHVRLSDLLAKSPWQWALSYDDHPRIRELYDWAEIQPVYVTYSNAVATEPRRPKNQEVVITPRVQTAT